MAYSKFKPHVYFIQEETDGPIKIGTALHPFQRLSGLQIGNPRLLHLRAEIEGGAALERHFHERFNYYRIRGEWFHPGHPILQEINRINSGRRYPAQPDFGPTEKAR